MLKSKLWIIAGVAVTLLILGVSVSFGQISEVAQESGAEEVTLEPQPEAETLWLWGEIIAVDSEKKELKVKYLDYDSYNEKEMIVGVDLDTAYENVDSFDEIKLQDTVSLDYITDSSGANIAKNISVERLQDISGEASEETMEDSTSITPEAMRQNIDIEEMPATE